MYCDEEIEFDEGLEPRDPGDLGNIIADLTTSIKSIDLDIWRDYSHNEFMTMRYFLEQGKLEEDQASHLLMKHFFPRFHRMLDHLLSGRGHKRADIAEWYLHWKSMIPGTLLQRTDVLDQLLIALRIMHSFLVNSRRSTSQPTSKKREIPVPTPDLSRMTISKWTEILAAQHNIAFAPLAGKRFESNQLYRMGDERIYFLDKVVYIYDPLIKKYAPTSPAALVNRCL
ncbi:hypothetical protein QR680_013623 [Steinernema hermaphroditum]|uniref:Uncharacterized protein n=1 Tax=Steinernema hermaphroditum TaxID=289476 RepID=A0AA39M2T8_9BILA|nr:hypothetical protein QR680_013623 [Steinernema hermaphroditum]